MFKRTAQAATRQQVPLAAHVMPAASAVNRPALLPIDSPVVLLVI